MTMQRGKERNIPNSLFLSLFLTKTQLCDQSNNSKTPDAMTLVPRFPPFPKNECRVLLHMREINQERRRN